MLDISDHSIFVSQFVDNEYDPGKEPTQEEPGHLPFMLVNIQKIIIDDLDKIDPEAAQEIYDLKVGDSIKLKTTFDLLTGETDKQIEPAEINDSSKILNIRKLNGGKHAVEIAVNMDGIWYGDHYQDQPYN